jgi:hypothetical protein
MRHALDNIQQDEIHSCQLHQHVRWRDLSRQSGALTQAVRSYAEAEPYPQEYQDHRSQDVYEGSAAL